MSDNPEFRRILLGYDGSPGSDRAAELAAGLARKYEAVLIVCHAFGQLPVTAKPSQVRQMMSPLLDRLSQIGISPHVSIPGDQPAQGILKAADEHQADLIVLGSHGEGCFPNLLLGSTVERVLRYAKVPVLVAR